MFCAVAATASLAQTFLNLTNLTQNGANPRAPLVQGTDGNLYGTTSVGTGPYGAGGTAFRITPSGELTTIYSFCSLANCGDGSAPYAALVQANDGNFYGTTYEGGAQGGGTVFRITPNGGLTTIYSFCSQANCNDGASPMASLVQAVDGSFYGTTQSGGSSGYGTVFKVTSSGTLTTLHSFSGADGVYPEAGLVQAADGNFYGTTENGGSNNEGTVFRITPGGVLTTLLSFNGADGSLPPGNLVQGTDGDLYGITDTGGGMGNCLNSCGTVFKTTLDGILTTLHTFEGTPDGAFPL
jgi:uncharacterized repeat protein (TIGR03803 family)